MAIQTSPFPTGDLAATLAAGWTLPAAWYSDPATLALEQERIFAPGWHYLAHAAAVAEPGSFLAGSAGLTPIVATRDDDGELRAFVNVCRHRGHLVASGDGCRRTLQCPYHAWTYGLDGRLLRAPRSEREPGFDPDALSLLPVAVESWGPLLFANADPEAAPLAGVLEGVRESVEASGVEFEQLRFHTRVAGDLAANWKTALENYLECYHCPVAHPGLAKVVDVDVDAYRLVERQLSSSQYGTVRPGVREGTVAADYVPADDVESAQYHYLWPATTLNIEPGRPNLGVDTWVPAGPGRTIGASDYYFGPDVTEAEKAEIVAFSQQVGFEDNALVEGVQAGLTSRAVPHGRLLGESERLIAHFQRLVCSAVA